MRGIKAFFALLLTLTLSLSLISCNKTRDRDYDEGEVKAAARELIEASILLNEIYYGEGIPIAPGENTVTQGNYKEADLNYLHEHGIVNLKSLREKTTAVFSEELSEQIFATVLESIREDGVVRSYVRYFEKVVQNGMYLMVDTQATVYFTGEREYLYDTMTVLGAEGEHVRVSLTVKVEDEEGVFHDMPLTVSLIEEKSGWRLDSPTYMKYSEYLENL